MADAAPRTTLKLKAPPGTDEANFGTERFRVDNSGEIDVPADAAEPLLNVGGFVMHTDPTSSASVGDIYYRNPTDPTAGFSCGGVSYSAGADGTFTAPAELAVELVSHGFFPVEAPPAA